MSSKGKLNGNQNSPEPKWMELHDGTFSLIDDELNDSIIAQHFQPNHKKVSKIKLYAKIVHIQINFIAI